MIDSTGFAIDYRLDQIRIGLRYGAVIVGISHGVVRRIQISGHYIVDDTQIIPVDGVVAIGVSENTELGIDVRIVT